MLGGDLGDRYEWRLEREEIVLWRVACWFIPSPSEVPARSQKWDVERDMMICCVPFGEWASANP